MIDSLQGEFPCLPPTVTVRKLKPQSDSDDDHDPHSLIQDITAVIDERMVEGNLQFKCTFEQAANLPTSTKLISDINESKVIAELVRCKAHITIPEDIDYWLQPDDESSKGVRTLRIQSKRRNSKLDCV